MKKWVLLFRAKDEWVFEAIKSGKKDVETRAGSDGYFKIKVGEVLVFKCGEKRIEKRITSRKLFSSIDELLGHYDLGRIMPGVKGEEEARKVWRSFPGYEERIKEKGLIAWEIE